MSLKLQLGEEVRRLGKIPDSIKSVKQKAIEMFGIEDPCFRYKDKDGDLVTILTQEEYLEACIEHSDPFKFEVLESKVVALKRSAILNSCIECDSFMCPEKVSFISHSENEFKEFEHSASIQTDEISYVDKETIMKKYEEKACEARFTEEASVLCENAVESYSELTGIIKRIFSKPKDKKRLAIGVKCMKCLNEVYDVLYRCEHCPGFYLCQNCEVTDSHHHVLIKSRHRIQSSPEKICELRSAKSVIVNNEDIKQKIAKLKTLGFENQHNCIEALIKCGYSLERSVDYLLNKPK